MNYRLTWLEYWSDQRESSDPRVLTRYTILPDYTVEHENNYYFVADNDDEARKKARDYIDKSTDPIDVFSVYNRKNDEAILTEED